LKITLGGIRHTPTCDEIIYVLKEIDELPNVRVWYTLDVPPEEGWKYSSGFINEEMVTGHLPKAGDTTYIFCCGPPPMIEYACKPNLAKAGHKETHIHVF